MGQGATRKDRFCVRVLLGIGQTDGKSACLYQGSKRDAHQEAAEHIQGNRDQYELTMDMTLVLSTWTIADRLTQVPQQWFEAMKKENGPKPLISTVHIDELDVSQIMAIHRGSGHPGV